MSSIIVIVKNNTLNNIFIEDLGISILASNQIILSDYFDFTDIIESKNLKTFVSLNTLTINDGINDLNIENALKHISIQSVFEDSFEDGIGNSEIKSELPTLSISKLDSLSLNDTFIDISFQNKLIESNSEIIELDLDLTKILIKESGYYNISYQVNIRNQTDTNYTYLRIFKNNILSIPQTERNINSFRYEVLPIVCNTVVYLEINDFITLQGRRDTINTSTIISGFLTITKNEGVKGDPGPPGGTTVEIKNNNNLIVQNCSSINFEGDNVLVEQSSSNQVRVGITNYNNNKFIQVYDSNGNINVNSNTPTPHPFNTEIVKDTDVFNHSNNVNNSRIYILRNGFYRVSYSLSYKVTSNIYVSVTTYIRKNESSILIPSRSFSYNRYSNHCVTNSNSFIVFLNSSDFIELVATNEEGTYRDRTLSIENSVQLNLELLR